MNHYYATNGYVGMNEVHTHIIAETEDEALQEARKCFKEQAERESQPKSFYENLHIDVIKESIKFPYNTGVTD